jgi:PEP-CTERM motif
MIRVSKLALAGAIALFSANVASATVVDFEEKLPFYCNSGSGSSAGLNYSGGFADCYYSPTEQADFPTTLTSTVMASGYGTTLFTRTGGGVFSLASADLAFGPFNHNGLESDTTEVIGTFFGGGTVSTVLNVGYGFQTYQFAWNNLVSVSFGELASASEYLAFDNIVYNAVPEPASWVMLMAGFGLAGAALRRRRTADRVVSC